MQSSDTGGSNAESLGRQVKEIVRRVLDAVARRGGDAPAPVPTARKFPDNAAYDSAFAETDRKRRARQPSPSRRDPDNPRRNTAVDRKPRA
jgi:hypothetical protein